MDDEANLKRQARRRLIGAVALVTAVVVILPMVLEREPKPGGQDIDLRIPDPDKAGEFKSQLELPAEVASAPVSAPSAASPVAAVEKPAVPAPVAPVAVPPAASAPQPSKPPTEAKPEAATQTQVGPQPKVKPQPKAQAPAAEHIAKKPAEQTAVKPVPKQGFVVQVGAFSRAATAEQLQQKLHKLGFRAYTEKVGNNVRVRVGPYASRAAAQKDLNKLKAQGMHPVLAKLD